MRSHPGIKTQFTAEDIEFLKENFYTMTNVELAKYLDLSLSVVRNKCAELGLKKVELEYWTEEQIQYLKDNYESMGDTELAQIFKSKWKKNKDWTKKHIEKKRMYLKLKRTPEQIEDIHERNVKNGAFAMCPHLAWAKRGVTPVGEVRVWRHGNYPFRVIKMESGFVQYAHYLWEKYNGPVQNGMCIRIIDQSKDITIDNLEMITRSENQLRNASIRSKTPIEIIRMQSLINKLNKRIKANEK